MVIFRINLITPSGEEGPFTTKLHQGAREIVAAEWYEQDQAFEAFVMAIVRAAPGTLVELLIDGEAIVRCRAEPAAATA